MCDDRRRDRGRRWRDAPKGQKNGRVRCACPLDCGRRRLSTFPCLSVGLLVPPHMDDNDGSKPRQTSPRARIGASIFPDFAARTTSRLGGGAAALANVDGFPDLNGRKQSQLRKVIQCTNRSRLYDKTPSMNRFPGILGWRRRRVRGKPRTEPREA